MRTMMLIAISLATMVGCAVEPDLQTAADQEEGPERDRPSPDPDRFDEGLDIPGPDRFGEGFEQAKPWCASDADCYPIEGTWVCDVNIQRCVDLGDLPF